MQLLSYAICLVLLKELPHSAWILFSVARMVFEINDQSHCFRKVGNSFSTSFHSNFTFIVLSINHSFRKVSGRIDFCFWDVSSSSIPLQMNTLIRGRSLPWRVSLTLKSWNSPPQEWYSNLGRKILSKNSCHLSLSVLLIFFTVKSSRVAWSAFLCFQTEASFHWSLLHFPLSSTQLQRPLLML